MRTASEVITLTPAKSGNVTDTEYNAWIGRMRAAFTERAAEEAIFRARVGEDLWTLFLDSLPADQRQYHNCSACRHFITRYGGLAWVDPERGVLRSAVWDHTDPPELYRPAVNRMREVISQGVVDTPFYSKAGELGRARTGVWTHFALPVPASCVPRSLVMTPGQAMAAKRHDFETLMQSLGDYSLAEIEKALHLLRSGALYRGEKAQGLAEWLNQAAQIRAGRLNGRQKSNLMWRAVAAAPPGWCHPRSSVLGTLLDDLTAGTSYADAAAKFAAKMHPLQYQRPQAPPSTGTIDQAEKIVEKMGPHHASVERGIAASLRRRYARFEELPDSAFIWRPAADPAGPTLRHRVFDELRDHNGVSRVGDLPPTQTYTWAKFRERVLPTAKRILVRVPGRGAFGALVTAADPDAPLIFQWSHPFSWYFYAGGSSCTRWSLTSTSEVDVRGVVAKPAEWGPGPVMPHHAGDAALFLLDGARDTGNPGLALFPETLKSDLHPIRSVIEAYSQRGQMEGAGEASACGLLAVSRGEVIVVTATGHRAAYHIDRWD